MSWVRVAKRSEIPADGGLAVRVGDLDLGLYAVGDAVHAIDDRCPHAGWPLSQGFLSGPVITCPLHFWDFDVRTGRPPGEARGRGLACYRVRVEDDEVFVEVPAPEEVGDGD